MFTHYVRFKVQIGKTFYLNGDKKGKYQHYKIIDGKPDYEHGYWLCDLLTEAVKDYQDVTFWETDKHGHWTKQFRHSEKEEI